MFYWLATPHAKGWGWGARKILLCLFSTFSFPVCLLHRGSLFFPIVLLLPQCRLLLLVLCCLPAWWWVWKGGSGVLWCLDSAPALDRHWSLSWKWGFPSNLDLPPVTGDLMVGPRTASCPSSGSRDFGLFLSLSCRCLHLCSRGHRAAALRLVA